MKKYLLFLFLAFIIPSCVQSQVKEISRDWTSFTQSITISTNKKVKFKIQASVKLITSDKKAWAGLWARVDNKNNETGFFDNMGDRPIVSDQWDTYTIEGSIDKNSEKLYFGGLCFNNGLFYFDKFELFIENKNGDLEKIDVPNFSFEKETKNENIPNWSIGISSKKPIKIKEFTVSIDSSKVDGKNSLLITGSGIEVFDSYTIHQTKEYTPQIGTLVSMLNNLSQRVEQTVKNLDQRELDHLLDEKANSIGALIMHLAAAEKFYQVYTFENRRFNQEEKEKWLVALDLGEKAQNTIKGHDVEYYLDIYREVRKVTLENLKKRDDEWLSKQVPGSSLNNHFSWFHVMEHQSSHLGQILLLKKRIPPKEEEKLNIGKSFKN